MIYKPRCEYAHAERKTSALYCSKVNGYCAFQYRCELTGQYENTATAVKCKARNKHEHQAPTLQSVREDKEILGAISEAVASIGEKAEESTLSLNEFAGALSNATENDKNTIETIEPESERSKKADEMEQPEHKTSRRTSGTKRGRRKKCDDVSTAAVQAGVGGTTGGRVHRESSTDTE